VAPTRVDRNRPFATGTRTIPPRRRGSKQPVGGEAQGGALLPSPSAINCCWRDRPLPGTKTAACAGKIIYPLQEKWRMWQWESELRSLGFQRKSEHYWQCERRFGLPGYGHLSVYCWGEHVVAGGRLLADVSTFHVTFKIGHDNVHFYYLLPYWLILP